ncbi:hypothetical protein EMIHUDRAFT_432769 [Emiliania huxleyi CCMP1516]|uniref:G-protein coupled receptors family 3 profile domain-containing protein n=2 Tax=Emiliania huxleyi TaxID=2903 RepID=A0A0D3IUM4_EMIH1|nr:hypothetical protein EMIHUDRAFT_432769 [Emiliania huxleyi CCMP1516]EOD14959.1 hypothetical protein EMIHUDRAFT_432769 [Emiliania huxleyi CCMP1516]|eukprot:XP_005767388.1 hypothetical protein EMIHUDRAFT_432769 [Emiliania huxleyi CCMP1516]
MQENMVNLMQVDMLQLGVLQTQMDNLSVQATLIIGFALSMWAGETLMPLLEDDSQLCIWKSWYHLFFASVFFIFVAVCISCCLIIVSIVSYIKQAAQEAALIVSTGAAVAVTRQHLNTLNYYFVVAYASFTLSAVLLIILYVGLPSRLPADTAVPTPARCASTHAPALFRLAREKGRRSAPAASTLHEQPPAPRGAPSTPCALSRRSTPRRGRQTDGRHQRERAGTGRLTEGGAASHSPQAPPCRSTA